MINKPCKTIVISGGDSWVNSGDEAILAGTLKLLDQLNSHWCIKIISGNKRITAQQFPEYEAINRNNLFKLFFELKNVDVFLWGGGHLIQNTSSKIFLLHQYFILMMAITQKKCLIGFSLGAEKIIGKLWQKVTKWILNRFTLISVRDEHSQNILNEFDLDIPVVLTADPAVILKPEPLENAEATRSNQKPYIIVSPRKWFDYRSSFLPVAWQRKIHQEDSPQYLESVEVFADICDWIIDSCGMNILFIAMYMENEQSDDVVARAIKASMKNKAMVSIIDRHLSPQELLWLINGADFLIGMRMHSTILGACANIPIIGLYYQKKGKSFFSALNLDEYSLPIEDINLDQVISIVSLLKVERQKMIRNIERGMAGLRSQAVDNMKLIEKIIESNDC